MTTFFDSIPQELTLLIFQHLETIIDSRNFIKGTNLIGVFSDSSVWKYLFSHAFGNLNLTRVTYIDYTSKDYMYYLLLYRELIDSYKRALEIIDSDKICFEDIIYDHNTLKDNSYSLNDTRIDIEYSINISTFYKFANPKLIEKFSSLDIDRITSCNLVKYFNENYRLIIHINNVEYDIEMTQKDTTEFLMYTIFNNIEGGYPV